MTPAPWSGRAQVPPPAGLMALSDGPADVKLGFATCYIAVLQKGGVWLTVRATSQPLLMKTLRSLEPMA